MPLLLLKYFIYAIGLAVFAVAGLAHAEDVMILNESGRAVVTGRVTGVGNGLFTLNHNGREVVVSTNDLDLGRGSLRTLLGEGVYVTVEGSLENGDILEARRVIRSEAPVIVDNGVILDESTRFVSP